MIIKNITKLVVAVVLTLAIPFGANALDAELGVLNTPIVYACGNGTGGGGC